MTNDTHYTTEDEGKEPMDLAVLRAGALAVQVCTNAKTKKEIERLTNEAIMCGTTGGWKLDEKESKKLGQPKVNCAERDGYTHYILYA